MQVANYAELSAEELTSIEDELMGQENLQQVLQWAQNQPKELFVASIVADVIVQDEFTHDVIIPWRKLFLVYGTT